MDRNNIGELLISKGEKFYSLGKKGIIALLAGIGLDALICVLSLIIEGRVYFLSGMEITVIGSIVSILLAVVGLFLMPFFFFGLHYLGLGKICKNTEE